MKAVIQRVTGAKIVINGEQEKTIGPGLVVLLGVGVDDEVNEADILANKAPNLRIFDDENGVMNVSLLEKEYDMLVVSQFTLLANCVKGRRPSYTGAAGHELAIAGYERFIEKLKEAGVKNIQTGEFGADMQITLTNDGPVTICLDSKELRRK